MQCVQIPNHTTNPKPETITPQAFMTGGCDNIWIWPISISLAVEQFCEIQCRKLLWLSIHHCTQYSALSRSQVVLQATREWWVVSRVAIYSSVVVIGLNSLGLIDVDDYMVWALYSNTPPQVVSGFSAMGKARWILWLWPLPDFDAS